MRAPTFNTLSRFRPFWARALHGFTARRMAVGVALLMLFCIFSSPAVAWLRHGVPLGTASFYVGLIVLSESAWVGPTVVLGLLAYNLSSRWHTFARFALAASVVALGAAAWPATFWIDSTAFTDLGDRTKHLSVYWLRNVALAGFMLGTLILVTRDKDAARELAAEELREIDHDRAYKAARLQAAQAQIEPHFLFNTLANVKRLYQLDASAGQAMLRNLSQLLGSALGQMRDERSTLTREVGLALAYLRVQEIRMGDRLRIETRVPEALRSALLPSMMLSTLVENAIKHGIAPLREGGIVRIEADAAGDVLRVKVTDSGRGLVPGDGTGVGLANIEARLTAEFGRDGELTLEDGPSGGTVATIALPLQFAGVEPHIDERIHA